MVYRLSVDLPCGIHAPSPLAHPTNCVSHKRHHFTIFSTHASALGVLRLPAAGRLTSVVSGLGAGLEAQRCAIAADQGDRFRVDGQACGQDDALGIGSPSCELSAIAYTVPSALPVKKTFPSSYGFTGRVP